jgi:hypothetical protein
MVTKPNPRTASGSSFVGNDLGNAPTLNTLTLNALIPQIGLGLKNTYHHGIQGKSLHFHTKIKKL